MTPSKTLKLAGILHLVIFCICTALMASISPSERFTYSFALGSIVMGLNVLALVWTWGQIIDKKAIALAAVVIVLKYAILGAIIYIVVTQQSISITGFLIGFATVAPTLIGLALLQKRSV